jgi:transcription termination factor Rho
MPVKKQTGDSSEEKKITRTKRTVKSDVAAVENKPVTADSLDEGVVTEPMPVSVPAAPVVESAPVSQPVQATAPYMSSSNSPSSTGHSYSYTAGQTNRPNNGMNRRPMQSSMGGRPMSGQPMRRPMRQSGNDSMGNRGSDNNSASSNYGNNNYSNNGYQSTSYRPNSYESTDPSTYTGDVIAIKGMLEILPDYGVIRQENHPYDNPDLPKDVYISQSQIRRFSLRSSDMVTGFARPPKEGERYLSLLKVDTVEGKDPEEAKKRPQFNKLTPIFPTKWLKLETETEIISTRLIDLVAPIGKGQRAMIVAPPKAGKTWLLRDIANGITTNYPDVTLLVALIGERPEEVTHFSRSVKGEVYASNFDEKAEEQTRIAEICLERAKRMAEIGKDVVILMDSLTRIARAYNMVAPPSGRTLTGGFDPAALYPAKHFFGAARNFEEGGSLTIIATALVETGSRMDDVIFEEFKGTGNMELRLDRALSERRIFPAIDIKASGTRHEEYLLSKAELELVFRLRRMVDLLDDREATELVVERLRKAKSNKEFLENLHKGQ